MPVAVQKGDVDSAAFVLVLECELVGLVEEVGVEDDGAVRAVRNPHGFGSGARQSKIFCRFLRCYIP